MRQCLVEGLRNASFNSRPVRGQSHGKIAVAKRKHRGEEAFGAGIVSVAGCNDCTQASTIFSCTSKLLLRRTRGMGITHGKKALDLLEDRKLRAIRRAAPPMAWRNALTVAFFVQWAADNRRVLWKPPCPLPSLGSLTRQN